jgi:DNA-directed RNA polymerase specialized sigma24 family protein/HJR/Mrr/RecB family endonuclease
MIRLQFWCDFARDYILLIFINIRIGILSSYQLTNLLMDQTQFERIYCSRFQQLELYVYGLVKDRKVAESIAAESFMKLWDFRNELTNERAITFRLLTHTRQAVQHHLTKNQDEIQGLQEFLHSLATTLGFVNEQNIDNYDIQELNIKIKKLPDRLKAFVELSMQGLNADEIAGKLGVSTRTVHTLNSTANKFLFSNNSIEKSNDTNNSNCNIQQINIIKDEINAVLIKHLATHPHKMYDLDPYKFEKLVAALMKDMGYDVYHTSQTRDGGRDIIAVMKTPSNDQIVTIVECKRYRADRVIGIDIVKSFLYTIREQDKANAGWIVTTSTFSPEAINEQKKYKWQLSLKDNNHLTDWCSNYGQWKQSDSGGLWLPNNPLA